MSKRGKKQVVGRWLAGPNAGHAGMLREVRAGLVYGALSDGTPVFGSPHEFQAVSGESGEMLLELLLPQQMASHLFEGTIREALASAHSTAVLGRQDTRAWERPHRYIVDDGEGDAAVVQLVINGMIGGLYSHHPMRSFEFHAEVVPEDQRAALASLLRLPFLQSAGPRVTAIFWTERDRLSSPEPWFKTYLFGGEILRRELLDAEMWQCEAAQHYDIDPSIASTIVDISRRATPLREIVLTADEVALVLPSCAEHREEALEQLFGGGVFMAEAALHR